MKRNNAFALILLGVGLSIGCNNPPLQNTTNTTTAHTLDANTQTPAQFCETNCEEKAFDLKVSPGKSLPLKPEEQNSLNDALKERPDTQTHIEGAAVNGAIQFHPAPGPARITAEHAADCSPERVRSQTDHQNSPHCRGRSTRSTPRRSRSLDHPPHEQTRPAELQNLVVVIRQIADRTARVYAFVPHLGGIYGEKVHRLWGHSERSQLHAPNLRH